MASMNCLTFMISCPVGPLWNCMTSINSTSMTYMTSMNSVTSMISLNSMNSMTFMNWITFMNLLNYDLLNFYEPDYDPFHHHKLLDLHAFYDLH